MNRSNLLQTALFLALFSSALCPAQDKTPAKAANPELVRTFTTSKPLKLKDAVADFVIDLIHKNTAGVQDQYARLTAKTEEAAGGRYFTKKFEGIQWFVNEYYFHTDGDKFEMSGDYVYLARQQLGAGFHGGYAHPVNIVGQVHVETALTGKGTGEGEKDGEISKGTTITLTFEGFLSTVPVESPQ